MSLAEDPNAFPKIDVKLTHHSYPIYIGVYLGQLIQETAQALALQKCPFVVVTDENVARVQAELFETTLADSQRLVLPAGEGTKSMDQLEAVYDFLVESGMDRSGSILAVGGGVIGDLCGFAAASFLRGIGFYLLPTTLLAMVDSAVGGKTGINLPQGKNLVGAFYQPQAVYIDVNLLKTLPQREFAAGMAEVIKYGLLADKELWEQLNSLKEPLSPVHPGLPSVIQKCCQIKTSIVEADEREQASSGGRALLNLGHTFAHALEATAGYGQYLHGEAVSIGLVLAAKLSQLMGWLKQPDVDAIRNLLLRYGLPVQLRSPLSINNLLEAMQRDKKVKQGHIKFILMHTIGEAITCDGIQLEQTRLLWEGVGAINDRET